MRARNVDGVVVTATEPIGMDEARAYVERGRERHADLKAVHVAFDGDFADVRYEYGERRPFERIRRITGYLVGTLDRWNDGKAAEERDRVKHGAQ